MNECDWLAEQFEANRNHLRAVAYRMLGSLSEAEDAVQEARLRLSRSDTSGVENLGGWLTTVVARMCLDMLRSRKSRREESRDAHLPESISDPEQEALLADSVGLALLVILETLDPAERLAFVLHDMFALPFDEIAGIVGRSPTAARQLASRARRRVQGTPAIPEVDFTRQREVVDAYLAAARSGDFEGLLAVLDPDVVLRSDAGAIAMGASGDIHGAWAVAEQAVKRRPRFAQAALVNGTVGIVVAPSGRLALVLGLTIEHGKISEINLIGDPTRLRKLDLAMLSEYGDP